MRTAYHFISSLRQPATAALLLVASVASQAAITPVTTLASFSSATNSAGTDNFSNLTINTFVGATSLNRTAGTYAYTMATQTDFYVAPVASAIAVSTATFSDTITFNGFASAVRAFGGNFYGTNVLGEVAGGGLTLVATDINNLTLTSTLAGGSASGFLGFISDAPLKSVVVSMTSPNTNVWASVDNVVLAAVPEASTWLMLLAGGAAVLRVAARRRAA